tara:strand:- start:11 stop:424 length:414 start_codon:yes stop_codon:yes gene_type:complete
MSRKTERVGRSGEFLTASVLAKVSDTVVVVPHSAEADVIFEWNSKLYKCQVKTRTGIEKGGIGWRFDLRRGSHSKSRKYKKNSLDVFALISVPYNTIYFLPFNCQKGSITISNEIMKNLNSLDSLDLAMADIISLGG